MTKRYRFIVYPKFENGRAMGWEYSNFSGTVKIGIFRLLCRAGNVIETHEHNGGFKECQLIA
jgi:hypothetical protein